MDNDLKQVVELYKESKRETLIMFNWTVSFVTISLGSLELVRFFDHEKISLIVFFNNPLFNILFSILFVILGILEIITVSNNKMYKNTTVALLVIWLVVYINQLVIGLSEIPNLQHILILPVIVLLFYMWKASVFIDEME